MVTKARSTRELMLDASGSLLRESGLSGAGIKQVVSRSGAPVGSVYHFFPGGKTQLVAESLRIQGEKAQRLLQRHLGDEAEPLPGRLRRFFRAAAEGFDRTGADKGCAIGAVTLDLDAGNEALRDVCREAFDRWILAIAPSLPWPDEEARRSFAEMIVAALEGAFILSRARQSGKPFIAVGEWLAATVESVPAIPRRRRARGIQRRRRRQPGRFTS